MLLADVAIDGQHVRPSGGCLPHLLGHREPGKANDGDDCRDVGQARRRITCLSSSQPAQLCDVAEVDAPMERYRIGLPGTAEGLTSSPRRHASHPTTSIQTATGTTGSRATHEPMPGTFE